MASVLIVFGSTGGNTEIVSEKVAEVLNESGHKVTLKHAELNDPQELLNFDVCIFASPTYGQGNLQEDMARFLKGCKELDLKGKKCAVIGLGDSKYYIAYIIESASILEKFIKDHGGELLEPSLKINKSPIPHLDGQVTKWAQELSQKI